MPTVASTCTHWVGFRHGLHSLPRRRRLQQDAVSGQEVRLTIRNALSNLTPAGGTTPPALVRSAFMSRQINVVTAEDRLDLTQWGSALSPSSNYSSVLAAQGMPNVSLRFRNATMYVRQVLPALSKANVLQAGQHTRSDK